MLGYRRNFSHECLKKLQIEFSESSDLKHNFLSSGLDWPCLLHSRVEAGLKRRINTLEAPRKHDVLKRRHLLANKKNASCENLQKSRKNWRNTWRIVKIRRCFHRNRIVLFFFYLQCYGNNQCLGFDVLCVNMPLFAWKKPPDNAIYRQIRIVQRTTVHVYL